MQKINLFQLRFNRGVEKYHDGVMGEASLWRQERQQKASLRKKSVL